VHLRIQPSSNVFVMAIEKKKKGEDGDSGPGDYLLYERGIGR
jgi:hypothetical protein